MATTRFPVPASACCAPLVRGPITPTDAERLAVTLKALADPARLRLLSLIAGHPGREACVCDLTAPLGLTQPTVSHHLKVLLDAGLVTRDKRGVWAYYRLVDGALDDLARVLAPNRDHAAIGLGIHSPARHGATSTGQGGGDLDPVAVDRSGR